MNRTPQYVPAAEILTRYTWSQMTLWRHLNVENSDFPRPYYFGRRRYFRLDEIEAWEASKRQRNADAA